MSEIERPNTIIEANYSRYPSIGATGRRPLPKDQLYIALGQFDSQSLFEQTQFWMSLQNDPHEDTGLRIVRQGAVTNMPFGNDLADEMVVPNFFGNPFVTDADRLRAASEATRVVRPLGVLTVVETINPSLRPVADVADVLGEFGFHQMNSGREYDPLTVTQYCDRVSETAYVAAFLKQ